MCQISDYELELMKVIWACGGTAMYTDIAVGLQSRGFDWSKNMIITMLLRLGEKEMVETSKVGRKNRYIARVTEEEYQLSQTKEFVEKIYNGKMRSFVATLVEQELLKQEDLDELKKYWESEVSQE